MKNYLDTENARNKEHAEMYTRLMKKAFGDIQVVIGHHLIFQEGNDIQTENEIPSADTLMFDHDVMRKVFGRNGMSIMRTLASTPGSDRDKVLLGFMDENGV